MHLLEKWKELQYLFTRNSMPDVYQDIQDGNVYKKLKEKDSFFSFPGNVGFILCCDGVQLFKSSNQSFWPILLAITSLPPGIRMNAENLILAGTWQGFGKPPIQSILRQVLDKIEHLIQGVPIESPHFNGMKVVKGRLIMAVFDLPARAGATNFLQFNGNYSCLYSLDKRVHVMHRQIFLPSEQHTPRNSSGLEQHAQTAEEECKTVMGCKGKSVLSSAIDLIEAIPVDYMHAILEGISRRLLSFCLDSKNHSCRFYLGRVTEEIDKKIKCIKPPQEFRRSPRSMSNFKQCKASEYRAWLFYYCLPVLSNLLPPDYIYHLSLLVSAMHILLGDTIPMSDVKIAQQQLNLFHHLVPELYREELCTANMHILAHLSESVQNWGPLWAYSCFGFESMNGHHRANCHGSCYVLPHTSRMRQVLIVKGRKIAERSGSPELVAFIHSLCGKPSSNCMIEVKGLSVRKK